MNYSGKLTLKDHKNIIKGYVEQSEGKTDADQGHL